MKESDIQRAIALTLGKHPSVAWVYVTTTGRYKVRGYWITAGFPGMSDILGQMRDGRLLAIEVKQSGNKPTEAQDQFLELVARNNGISGWCTSVNQALEIVEKSIAQ